MSTATLQEAQAAINTLKHLGYTYHGGEQWKPPLGAPINTAPDAIHHTDLSEHPEYTSGWNDCRAEMMRGMK
jgi:hypothetical protein